MKRLLKYCFLPLLLFLQFKATGRPVSFARVDRHAASIGYFPIDVLAEKLTVPFYTDSEKVRAIFFWVTSHISYDVVEFHNKRPMVYETKQHFKDSTEAEAYFMTIYANDVIKKGMGVCAGYATIFKLLCDKVKINCVIVNGYGKSSFGEIGKRFDENHAWNAVQLNGNWQLVDACWAAGYCDDAVTKFTREQNEYFFLTPPWLFIYNHYPADSKWTLLKTPVTREQFEHYPQWQFYNKNIIKASFTPLNGTLDAKIGDTLKIAMDLYESDSVAYPRELLFDEQDANGYQPEHEQPLKPTQQLVRNLKKQLVYNYVVWSKTITKISLVYSKEYLMSYKLQVH